MIKNKKENRKFIENIKNAVPAFCSSCGQKYSDDSLNLIKKDDYSAVLHLSCSKCQESYLINVVSPLGNLQGSSRMPLKVDVTSADEAKKFIGSNPITSDEVLSMHELLKKIGSADELTSRLSKKK